MAIHMLTYCWLSKDTCCSHIVQMKLWSQYPVVLLYSIIYVFPNLQENRGKSDSILQRLTHETELIVLSWRLCEPLSAIASYQWHRKQKDSKVSISIGAFNLKWQVSVSAIISKKLQWTPLINFVFWNSGLESSKYTSFVLIQRIDIWPFVILYCFFFPSVNFFLHSDFIESWKRCSQIKKKKSVNRMHTGMFTIESIYFTYSFFWCHLWASPLSYCHPPTDFWCQKILDVSTQRCS